MINITWTAYHNDNFGIQIFESQDSDYRLSPKL